MQTENETKSIDDTSCTVLCPTITVRVKLPVVAANCPLHFLCSSSSSLKILWSIVNQIKLDTESSYRAEDGKREMRTKTIRVWSELNSEQQYSVECRRIP